MLKQEYVLLSHYKRCNALSHNDKCLMTTNTK